jgi:hypothetical protein
MGSFFLSLFVMRCPVGLAFAQAYPDGTMVRLHHNLLTSKFGIGCTVWYSQGMTTTQQRQKGDLVGAMRNGHIVSLWYSSPTGDSSDSQIHDIVCLNEADAERVMQRHLQAWGLSF